MGWSRGGGVVLVIWLGFRWFVTILLGFGVYASGLLL